MGAMQTVGDVSRQLATVAGAGSFVGLGATGDYGRQQQMRSPVVPTNRTFSIWGPIYVGNLGLVAYQAARRRDPLLRKLGWPLAVAYGGAGLWSRAFDLHNYPLTLGLIGATTGAAGLAYARLPVGRSTPTEQWLVRVPVGLLFGWLTVASAAGATEELLDPKVTDLDPDRDDLAVATIAGVTAVAGAVTVGLDRTLAYPAAVAWGLGGIFLAQAGKRPAVANAAAMGLGALAIATTVALLRRRQRARDTARRVRERIRVNP